jgi:hypothetical protein
MPTYVHIPELSDVIDVSLWTDPHAYEKGMINKEEG